MSYLARAISEINYKSVLIILKWCLLIPPGLGKCVCSFQNPLREPPGDLALQLLGAARAQVGGSSAALSFKSSKQGPGEEDPGLSIHPSTQPQSQSH